MSTTATDQDTAMQLVKHMLDVEMNFLDSEAKDIETLASAFHRDVVIHEPASLPYAGDWRGLEGVAALIRSMSNTWSDVRVDDLVVARSGDTIFTTCTLNVTSRTTGVVVTQPFAQVLRFKDALLLDGTPFYFDSSELVAAIR